MMCFPLALLLTLASTGAVFADSLKVALPPVRAVRATSVITIDGVLSEADSTGRVSVYVAEQRFDYSVIRPAEVLLTSSATVFSGTEIGWDHPGSTGQNCVLIGVSWVAASEDTVADLASVSYGGVNIPVASALVRGGSSAIFRLLNPPSGTQAVLILLFHE